MKEPGEAGMDDGGSDEEPADLWDAEASKRFVADTVLVLQGTKSPYLRFRGDGIAANWFGGRDRLLEAAPWIGESVTKEQLGVIGAEIPLQIGVQFEMRGDYLNAVSFFRP
jgi:hypothetical protein